MTTMRALAVLFAILRAANAQTAQTIGTFEVLETISHDTSAFTQGLTFDPTDDSIFYESTGPFSRAAITNIE